MIWWLVRRTVMEEKRWEGALKVASTEFAPENGDSVVQATHTDVNNWVELRQVDCAGYTHTLLASSRTLHFDPHTSAGKCACVVMRVDS